MGKKIITLLLILITLISCNPNTNEKIVKISNLELPNSDTSFSMEEIEENVKIGVGSSYHSQTQESKIIKPSPQIVSESKISESFSKSFGQIVYKIPDTMMVLKNYEIVIRIQKGSKKINIEENLNGKITKKEIRVESKMEVKIKDPENKFEISEINKERQIIENDEYTEWRFGIKPKKIGKCKLNIVVSIIIGEDSKEIVYEDIIVINSNPKKQITSWWEENWKMILELILIPLGIWGYNLWKNRKE